MSTRMIRTWIKHMSEKFLSSDARRSHHLRTGAAIGRTGTILRPRLEPLEERVTPTTSWNQFNGNPQHTGISTVAAQPTDQILWQTPIDLYGSNYGTAPFWHTGEPVFTPNDTVIVPVMVTESGNTANAVNYEVEAFNGSTGALLWTVNSYYLQNSPGWTPPYQPVYDPVSNRVYFPGPGGTLYYISNPDNPGSSTPTPSQFAFYGTSSYTANESEDNGTIYIDTPLTVDNAGNVFFGYDETGLNSAGLTGGGGIARVNATETPPGSGTFVTTGTYVTTGTAVGTGTGEPAYGSAPALSNNDSILYVAIDDSNNPYLVGVNATTLASMYSVELSVPNSDSTGIGLENSSTAAPMVAPDGTVFMGVFAETSYDGSRGFMTHYSANLATEYTPGAFGWDDTPSIIPASMVPSYTGSSSYLILTKYNNYANANPYGGNGVNEIAILDPYATETDPNNDPNPSMLVMKQIETVTSPTADANHINSGYPDGTREWCTNGTAVDPATDSVFINNEDGYSYRWNLGTDTINQAVDITNGYGEPYTPTSIGPNGVVYALNGGTLFALGGYTNYTLTTVSSQTTVVIGQSITFTTTVASTNGGPVPKGSVTYSYAYADNTPSADPSTIVTLGTVNLVNGVASITTPLFVDHFHIIAHYNGDTADGYSAGSTTLVQVVLANPTTTVTSSASPVNVGTSVTLTATVNPEGIFYVPLGTVSFMDGNTLLGTVALNVLDQSTSPYTSQTATFATSSLPAGSDAITAVYSGDLNYAGSTSSTLTQVMVASTTTTLAVNGPDPSLSGTGASLTVTVNGGTLINNETVNVEDTSNNNLVVATPTLTNSTATFTLASLGVGSHNLIAIFSADTTHHGSQSSAVTQTVQSTFSVNNVTVTPSGVVLTFDAPINPATTVLYSSPGDTTLGAADVTVVGATTGAVRGSLVIDATNPYIATFVQTKGPLVPDIYTVTVTNAVMAVGGSALSGTFIKPMTVTTTMTPELSVPSFARGPGQSVALADSLGNATGIPVDISNATNVTQASFTLTYDPTLLTIAPTGALTLSSLANAAGMNTVSYNITTVDTHHSVLAVTLSSSGSGAGLTATTAETLVTIVASVPTTAPYLDKSVLNLSSVVVDSASAAGVSGVDVAADVGDVSGSGSISALSAALVDEVGSGAGTGFSVFKDLDPAIIGAVSGGALVSATDASLINEAGSGATIAQIPSVASGITPTFGGPDPYLYLSAVRGSTGQTVTETLYLDVTDPNSVQLAALDEAIGFDASVLQVSDVRSASGLAGIGSYGTASTVDNESGVLLVGQAFMGSALPPVVPYGTDVPVLQFDVTLNQYASVGSVIGLTLLQDGTINGQTKYTAISDNDGALTWTPGMVPSNSGNAAVDGSVTVVTASVPMNPVVAVPATPRPVIVLPKVVEPVRKVAPATTVSQSVATTAAPGASITPVVSLVSVETSLAAPETGVANVSLPLQAPVVLVQPEPTTTSIPVIGSPGLAPESNSARSVDSGASLSLAALGTNKAVGVAPMGTMSSRPVTSMLDEMYRQLRTLSGVSALDGSNWWLLGANSTAVLPEAWDLEVILVDVDLSWNSDE